MKPELKSLRHPKEKIYGTLVLVFGVIIWGLVGLSFLAVIATGKIGAMIIPIVEIGIIVLAIMIAKMFYRAYLFGHAILIGPDQLPHLYQCLAAGAQKLGMDEVPQAFVYNSNGLMNAFAMRIFARQMVMLTSALIDVESEAQVEFVIGHELGHHAAGHLGFWKNALKYPGLIVPFLGAAYHRSRELTADRFGAYCVNDLDASRSALHMLACGSAKLNGYMNAQRFAEQEDQVPSITGFLLHIFSGYPRLTRRVREVETFFGYHGGYQAAA